MKFQNQMSAKLLAQGKKQCRLLNDWQELQRDGLGDDVIIKIEDFCSKWHVWMKYPVMTLEQGQNLPLPAHAGRQILNGQWIHLEVFFPEDYPYGPPSIEMSVKIPHPNVFSWGICVDILQIGAWSSAYTMKGVLMQIYSFLFDENIPQSNGALYNNKISSAEALKFQTKIGQFRCDTCGFDVAKTKQFISPRLQIVAEDALYLYCEEKDDEFISLPPTNPALNIVNILEKDLFGEIVKHLDKDEDLIFLSKTCKKFYNFEREMYLLIKRQTRCFVFKEPQTKAVLGFGVSLIVQHDLVQKQGVKMQFIKEASIVPDFISFDAIVGGKKEGAYLEKFDYWIPLPIDANHCRKSMKALPRCIMALQQLDPSQMFRAFTGKFDPIIALNHLIKLMNSVVVKLCRIQESKFDFGLSDDRKTKGKSQSSERAIFGYTSLHHLLLQCVYMYPEIKVEATQRLTKFLNGKRSKTECSNLGEFLVYLVICPSFSWEQIAEPFLEEFFDRCFLWTFKQHPCLAYCEAATPSSFRVSKSFECMKTSLNLLMFQLFFLKNFGLPAKKTLKEIYETYNEHHGHPNHGSLELLNQKVKKFKECSTFQQCFKEIGFEKRNDAEMATILRIAMKRSAAKKYHTVGSFDKYHLKQDRMSLDLSVTLQDSGSVIENNSSCPSYGTLLKINFVV